MENKEISTQEKGQLQLQQANQTLLSLDENHFARVLSFLDSFSIKSLVFVNRETRLKVGRCIQSAFSIQQKWLSATQHQTKDIQVVCQNYLKILSKCECLNKEQMYKKFIQQLTLANSASYSMFYELCLDQLIKVDSNSLLQAKKLFLNLQGPLVAKLIALKTQQEVPDSLFKESKAIKELPKSKGFDLHSNGVLNPVSEFAQNFQEICRQLREKTITSQILKNNLRFSRYLKVYNNISSKFEDFLSKPSIKYQNKINYMPQNASIFTFLSPNRNQILLSFLTFTEIAKLRLVCKAFKVIVFSTSKDLCQQINQIQHDLTQESIDTHEETLFELIRMKKRIIVQRDDIYEMQSMKNLPKGIEEVYRLLFKLINRESQQEQLWRTIMINNNLWVQTLSIINNETTNPFQDIFYIQLNEAAMKAIEMFQQQFTLEQIQRLSRATSKIYLNILINYHLSKASRSRESYLQLQKTIERVDMNFLCGNKLQALLKRIAL